MKHYYAISKIVAPFFQALFVLLFATTAGFSQSSYTGTITGNWGSLNALWVGGVPGAGTNITLTASGGNIDLGTANMPGTAYGSLTLLADGTPRVITIRTAGATSFTDISIGENVTLVLNTSGSQLTATGDITGAGNLNKTTRDLVLSGDLNITGTLSSTAGNITTKGLNSNLSWSGSPVVATFLIDPGASVVMNANLRVNSFTVNSNETPAFEANSGTIELNCTTGPATFITTTGATGSVEFYNLTAHYGGGSGLANIGYSCHVKNEFKGSSGSESVNQTNLRFQRVQPVTWRINRYLGYRNAFTVLGFSDNAIPTNTIHKVSIYGADSHILTHHFSAGNSITGTTGVIEGTGTGVGLFNGWSLEFDATDNEITVTNPNDTRPFFTVWDLIFKGSHPITVGGNSNNGLTAGFKIHKDIVTSTNSNCIVVWNSIGWEMMASLPGLTEHEIGVVNGASLAGTRIFANGGSTLNFRQDVTLQNFQPNNDAWGRACFGVGTGSTINLHGNRLRFDINYSGSNPVIIPQSSTFTWQAGGKLTLNGINNILPVNFSTNSISLAELHITGNGGGRLSTAAVVTITDKFILEQGVFQNGSNIGTINMGDGSTVIRTGGSQHPTNGTFACPVGTYNIQYLTNGAVNQGREWLNDAAKVNNVTCGPTSGSPDATSLTIPTLGVRRVLGTLTLNSTGVAVVTSGLPLGDGATIHRYSGTMGGAPSFGTSVNIIYEGNFTSGVELPNAVGVLNNLIVRPASGQTVTLGSAAFVNGNLTVESGTFDLSTLTANRQAAGGVLTVLDDAVLKIGGTNTFPTNYSTNTLEDNSTVEYASVLDQTIGIQNYGNLIISGARTTNNITLPSGTIQIRGIFTPSATFAGGAYSVNATNTIEYLGGNGQTIAAFPYRNLSSSNNDRVLANSGTIGISGTFTKGSGSYTTTGSTVDYNGTGSQTVVPLNYNNLTISGSRGGNFVTLGTGENIAISGALSLTASFSTGDYEVDGSKVVFSGIGQSIPAFIFDELEVSQSSGNAIASGNIEVKGVLTLSGGNLQLGANQLIIGKVGSIVNASPSSTQMIDVGTGSVQKNYDSPTLEAIILYIGTVGNYSPVSISNLTGTGAGAIIITAVGSSHPAIANPSIALSRYWGVSVSGLTITSCDATFSYPAGDVNGSEGSYVVRRRSGGSWVNDGATVGSGVITATGINANLAGEWTAGEIGAFAAVTIYYSLGGPWNDPNSWSNVNYGGAPAPAAPAAGDLVQIGDDQVITVDAGLIGAASVLINSGSMLQIVDLPNVGNDLGAVSGTGTIEFKNSTNTTPTFPSGNFSAFNSSSGGTIKFAGSGNYVIPNLGSVNNLSFGGSGTKTISNATTIEGNLTVDVGVTLSNEATLSINGNLVINGTLETPNAATATDLTGNVVQSISGSGTKEFGVLNINGSTQLNVLSDIELLGNLNNNSAAVTGLNHSAGKVTVTGTASVAGSGSGANNFNNLEIGTAGSLTLNKNINLSGNLVSLSNTGTALTNNQTIIVLGGTQTLSGAGTGTILLGNVTIGATASLDVQRNVSATGTIQSNSNLGIGFTNSAGTLTVPTATTATLTRTGSGVIELGNVTIAGTGRLNTGADLNLFGTLNVTGSGLSGISFNQTAGTTTFKGTTAEISGAGSGSVVLNNVSLAGSSTTTVSRNVEIKGDFSNGSSETVAWDQTSGTTFFSGASVQSMTSSGSGEIKFNNIEISNTPSQLSTNASFSVVGNLVNASDGLAGISLNATGGIVKFSGGNQSISGSGSGSVNFNSIRIGEGGNTRVSQVINITVASAFERNSDGQFGFAWQSSPGTTITFGNAGAKTLSSIGGSGLIQFVNFAHSQGTMTVSTDYAVSGAYTHSSSGALTHTGSTLTVNGGTTQTMPTGSAVTTFNNLLITANTRFDCNKAISFTGNITNNSNGVGGNSLDITSGVTFSGGVTQSISGSGSGILRMAGITVNSGTRVNCTRNIQKPGNSSITFNGTGISGFVWSQTAGDFIIGNAGAGGGMSNPNNGNVQFHNLTFVLANTGNFSINMNLNVSETLSFGSNGANNAIISNGANRIITCKNLVFNNGGYNVAGTPTASRIHEIRVQEGISGVQIGGPTDMVRINGANVAYIKLVLQGTNTAFSPVVATQRIAGNVNFPFVEIQTGRYQIDGTLRVGNQISGFADRKVEGTGGLVVGASGTLAIALDVNDFNLDLGLTKDVTGSTVIYECNLPEIREVLTGTYHNLTFDHQGGGGTYFDIAGNITVNGNATLSAGTVEFNGVTSTFNGGIAQTGTVVNNSITVVYGGTTNKTAWNTSYNNVTKSGTHTLTFPATVAVNNLTASAGTISLGAGAKTLTVNGNLTGAGTIDMASGNHTLIITEPTCAFTGTLVSPTNGDGTVRYQRDGNQNVLGLDYPKLEFVGASGTRNLQGNGSAYSLDLGGRNFVFGGVSRTFTVTNNGITNGGVVDLTGEHTLDVTGAYSGVFDVMGGVSTVRFRTPISLDADIELGTATFYNLEMYSTTGNKFIWNNSTSISNVLKLVGAETESSNFDLASGATVESNGGTFLDEFNSIGGPLNYLYSGAGNIGVEVSSTPGLVESLTIDAGDGNEVTNTLGHDLVINKALVINSGFLNINNRTIISERSIDCLGGQLKGSATSNLIFNGTFGGSLGTISFEPGFQTLNNLTINNSGGANNLTLASDLSIVGNLTFNAATQKNIVTGSNTIDLGTTGTLVGEKNTSRVIGLIATEQIVEEGASTFAGTGFSLNAGVENLGTVSLLRRTGAAGISVGQDGNEGIERTYSITISGDQPVSGRNVTITWFENESNGKDFSTKKAAIFRRNTPSDPWVRLAQMADPEDLGSGVWRLANITTFHFSEYTVSDEDNPLPVVLASFRGQWRENLPRLQWVTVSEKNTSHFEVERSVANGPFQKVGEVKAAGESFAQLTYNFTDETALRLTNASLTYRLKIVDLDKTFEYSPLVVLQPNGDNTTLKAWPSPFSSQFLLEVVGYEGKDVQVEITNAAGAVVISKRVKTDDFGRIEVKGLNDLAQGVYFVNLLDTGLQPKKLIKQ